MQIPEQTNLNYNQHLRARLEQLAAFHNDFNMNHAGLIGEETNTKYSSMEDLIIQEGILCNPQELPRWYKDLRGAKGQCFNNAYRAAMKRPELIYVEGFAYLKNAPGFHIHHAWCIDKDCDVADVTWRESGCAYIGVPIATEALNKLILLHGRTSVIPDIVINDYNPIENGFPEGAVLPKGMFGQ